MIPLMPPERISPEGLHYLDFAANPSLILELLQEQLNDPAVARLKDEIIALYKINDRDGVYSKLQKIQRYIHDLTFHMTQMDRISLFGYLAFSQLPKSFPPELVHEVFAAVERGYIALDINPIFNTWEDDLAQERCVGSQMGSLSKSQQRQDKFNGVTPLQCAEEATLAAALAHIMVGIPLENMYFIVSPTHVVLLIKESDGLKLGCIFDSKMLFFAKDMQVFGDTLEARWQEYMGHFGGMWALVDSKGQINQPEALEALNIFMRGPIKPTRREAA